MADNSENEDENKGNFKNDPGFFLQNIVFNSLMNIYVSISRMDGTFCFQKAQKFSFLHEKLGNMTF